jgi:AcrR family transcriptional regulator
MTIDPAVLPERRQLRWHLVHDRLYDAACELFVESGYLGTSVDEIAERAGVSRKTAFNHYPRKRDFINEWGSRRRHHALHALPEDAVTDPRLDVVLRRYFAELAAINAEERALTISMSFGWRESGGPFDSDPHELIKVFQDFVNDAIIREEIPASVDAARTGVILYSSYFGLLYDWCDGTDTVPPFDLDRAFAQLLDIVLGGLRTI